MTDEYPAPLTPSDSDISDFGFMPLDVVRFRNSDLVAFESAEAVLAAVMLWGVSWHSTPAGSLTDDDRSLAQAAGYGRAVGEWQRVREGALRGFVKCSDGRLYHPVVAEKANEAWKAKLRRLWNTYCATIRKRNERKPEDQKEATPTLDDWLAQRDSSTMSRVTSGNVTRDKPNNGDDTDPMSRVTKADVARDLTRAREKGQGQGQGEGEGESKSQQQPLDSASPAKLRKREIDCWDVEKVADALARRAGIPNTSPTHIGWNLDMVRQWHGDGIDMAIVEGEIDRFRLDNPDKRLTTLSFFDSGIRAKIAAAEARQRKGGTVKASGPAIVLKSNDQPDERIAAIRAKLNGKPEHAPDAIALSAEQGPEGWSLVVMARSSFAATRIDRPTLAQLARDTFGPDADLVVRHQ